MEYLEENRTLLEKPLGLEVQQDYFLWGRDVLVDEESKEDFVGRKVLTLMASLRNELDFAKLEGWVPLMLKWMRMR